MRVRIRHEQRPEEVIPRKEEAEDAQRCQRWFRQGDDDAKENANPATAIDPSSFFEFERNRGKRLAQQHYSDRKSVV